MRKQIFYGLFAFTATAWLLAAAQFSTPVAADDGAFSAGNHALPAQAATPAPDGSTDEAPRIEVVATSAPVVRPTRAVVIGDPTLKVAGIGDTLALLSAQSGFSITDLAQRNRLTQANMLLVGQQLRMPQPFSPKIALHRVAPGETLLGIAARYGLAPYALQQMNKLPCADCLVAGQLLRIPQTKVEGNLPQPFTQIDIDPPAPIAGEVMSIRVYTSAPLKMLEGQIGKKTLPFFKKAEGLYIAITGIPALQQTEVVNIVLNASTDGDAKTELQGRIQLAPHNYGFQNVFVSYGLLPLLSPKINEAEQARLDQIYGQYTDEQWWDGTFKYPAFGDITSTYGARRNFNGGVLNTYHSGMDFRAFVGTPVQAPAAGKVVAVEQLDVRGLVVFIDHGRGVFSAYCHLSEANVRVGQMVKAGDVIAKSGNTGRTEGPHLHWEVAVGGVQVNPATWLSTVAQ